MFKQKKKIVTHNGSFHADDVFAVATILLAFPKEKFEIIRTRDEARVKKGDFVVDVGRIYDEGTMRFDHHQEGGAGKRENNIPYAAFGLVWKKFGEKICGKVESEMLDGGIVSFIDAGDSGVDVVKSLGEIPNCSISSLVAIFNATTLEQNKDDKTFPRLVDFAKEVILREIAVVEELIEAEKYFKTCFENSADKRLIILDQTMKREMIYEVAYKYPEVLFVAHPSFDKSWALRTVRKNRDSFESRKYLPKSWGGKQLEEFQKITGVGDAIFCHRNLFTTSAKSKEGVLALAKIALETNE